MFRHHFIFIGCWFCLGGMYRQFVPMSRFRFAASTNQILLNGRSRVVSLCVPITKENKVRREQHSTPWQSPLSISVFSTQNSIQLRYQYRIQIRMCFHSRGDSIEAQNNQNSSHNWYQYRIQVTWCRQRSRSWLFSARNRCVHLYCFIAWWYICLGLYCVIWSWQGHYCTIALWRIKPRSYCVP